MEQIYKTIDAIISAQKKARKDNNFVALMINAEALLEYIPQLIEYSINQEHYYRKYEAELSNKIDPVSMKSFTSSYCDTQAKATEEYKNWQRAKQTIDWMYEVVNMSKKLAGTVLKDENNG